MFFTDFLSLALALTFILAIWSMPFIAITLAVSPSTKDKFICKKITIYGASFVIFSAIYLHYFPVDGEYIKERNNEIYVICKTHDTYVNNGYTKTCPSSTSH